MESSKMRFLAPPPEHIEQFHFGFRESMADSLWLRWIQDSEVCQTYAGAKSHHAAIDLDKQIFPNPRYKVCDNSWAYRMLDAVTRLAPRFEMPYTAGAITLSVVVEDYDGAKLLFDRGIAAYPKNWQLLYRAAYHYLFDRQELTRAAELLVQAGDAGAPIFVKLLAARLYTKAGQAELGITTLQSYRKLLTKKESIEDVDERIRKLRLQLQQ